MSLIHIARNNVVLGQFTETDVAAGVQNGAYLPTDLAWRPGMSQWKPLGEWPEFAGNTAAEIPVPPVFQNDFAGADQTGPAWERRKEIGFFTALIETTKQVLKTPDATFAAMKRSGGFGSPLSYYLIPQLTLALVMSALMTLMMAWMASIPSGQAQNPVAAELQKLLGDFSVIAVGIGYFVIFAIWAPLAIFFIAGVNHLMLRLWGAAHAPFEVTFRTTAYAMGAFTLASVPLQIFGMIPCIGAIFGMVSMALFVWVVIILIKGYSITHGSSGGRCAGAVLTPLFVCCCGLGLAYGAFFFTAISHGATRH